MAKLYSKWLSKNINAFKDTGNDLDLNLNAVGGIEVIASGVGIKTTSVTDAMLAGGISFAKLTDAVNIGRLDQNETVVGKWDFATGVNVPTINSVDIATVADVSASAAGLSGKQSVTALLDTNVVLNGSGGGITFDGYVATSNIRVLLIGQTNPIENGIYDYNFTTFILTRPTDFITGGEASTAYVLVDQGATYADQAWMCNSNTSTIIDTNAQSWSVFSRRTAYVSGDGLTLIGSTFAVDVSVLVGTGIENDGANNFRVATQGNGIAGGGGTTLSVAPDITTGGNIAPVTVGVNGVGVDVTALDGDHLIVNFAPSNWTPTSTGAPTSAATNDLAAQFKGIDNKFLALSGSTVPNPEVHTITTADVTAGFFTLTGTPNNNFKVMASVLGGLTQLNAEHPGAGVTLPDFQILNGNQLHFLNVIAAGLSNDIGLGDILQITFL